MAASKKMTRYIHTIAKHRLPSKKQLSWLIQKPLNKMLVPHCGSKSGTPMVNHELSGATEGSSQLNTWPAAQMNPGPLRGVWIGWECRKDDVGPWWKCVSSLIQMYVTVGRDRVCLILWYVVVMPPITRGQAWLCQPLAVSTVPNTGRNISISNYRGLEEEENKKQDGSSDWPRDRRLQRQIGFDQNDMMKTNRGLYQKGRNHVAICEGECYDR